MSVEFFRGPGGVPLGYRYDDFTDPWTDAPTAVLAHGFPRNSNHWYAWVPLLSRQFKVVRMDLRGLGLSKMPLEIYHNSVEERLLDAIALLDHLKVEKAVFFGEATGSMVGMSLATRVPERLHALIVMNFPLNPGALPLDQYGEKLGPGESIVGQASLDLMLSKGMRMWAQREIRTRPWLKAIGPGYGDWYVDQLAQNDARLCHGFYSAMTALDMSDEVKDIAVPMLIIDGDNPSVVSDKDRKLLAQNPNVRFVTYEGPGFDLGYTQPERCSEEAKKFLRELGVLPK